MLLTKLRKVAIASLIAGVVTTAAGVLSYRAVAQEKPAGAPAQKPGETGLTLADFEKLHKQVKFTKTGMWAIPWHASLTEAREQAAKEKKPIFLMTSHGHSLAVC
ncbi:hypothetical protein AYO44_06640 [Planctomycetaceae bacterium SCGC AG-212-F19]|nr:hypothetical protein AYO44_06640 [Planctomycetaceae bacterium SCGC AG-212-F19]